MRIIILLPFLALCLTACVNSKIANDELLTEQAKVLASSATMTPEQSLNEAQKKIDKAQKARLDFYAPLHFKAAKDALVTAKGILQKGEGASLVLEQAFRVESLLGAGYKNREIVQSKLAPSLEHLGVLEKLKAPAIMPSRFTDVMGDMEVIIREMEGGFIEKAVERQPKLLESMTKLEVDLLKKVHLTAAEDMLDKADEAKADKYAEQTFKKAEQALADAKRFIEKQYRNRTGVKSEGIKAWVAAARAYRLAKESEQMVNLTPQKAEQRALYFESLLELMNSPLQIKQLETKSFAEQAKSITKRIQGLNNVAEPVALPTQAPPLTSGIAVEGDKKRTVKKQPEAKPKP